MYGRMVMRMKMKIPYLNDGKMVKILEIAEMKFP